MDTDLLAELIEQKHDLLVQLRQLSRRQVELINDGDMTKLMGVLAAKQQLLRALQPVDQQLDVFRKQDPEQRVWRSAADRARCRQSAERCEALLQEIMLVERESEADLIRRRDQAAKQLQGIHMASEARSAYTQSVGPNPGQIDLSSQE